MRQINISQVALTNLPKQQIKQSNSLINFVQTQEEAKFVSCFDGKPTLINAEDKTYNNLIDTLAKWRWMAGVSIGSQDENDIAKELALLATFIINNYNFLTIEEINLSIDLSLTDKLDVDTRTFNSFSPIYVSKILNSYIIYKRKSYNELCNRRDSIIDRNILEQKPTLEQKRDSMVELIKYFYDIYKENGEINDFFSTLYNFFKRTNRINPDKKLIELAMEYAAKKSIKELTEINGVKFNDIGTKVSVEKRYARNYCVQKYFETINLEYLILSIKKSEFE